MRLQDHLLNCVGNLINPTDWSTDTHTHTEKAPSEPEVNFITRKQEQNGMENRK